MEDDLRTALWHRYTDEVIILIRLPNGRWAVFNNAREFHAFIEPGPGIAALEAVLPVREPPKPVVKRVAKRLDSIDLKELGL